MSKIGLYLVCILRNWSVFSKLLTQIILTSISNMSFSFFHPSNKHIKYQDCDLFSRLVALTYFFIHRYRPCSDSKQRFNIDQSIDTKIMMVCIFGKYWKNWSVFWKNVVCICSVIQTVFFYRPLCHHCACKKIPSKKTNCHHFLCKIDSYCLMQPQE